jgi:hypothetical protein
MRNGTRLPRSKSPTDGLPRRGWPPTALLCRVVDHYHRTFCGSEDAQAFLAPRTPLGLLRPEALEEIAIRQKPPNGSGDF